MNKSELKMRYDPRIDRYVKKHIYTGEIHGEGLMDIFKLVGNKLLGRTTKDIAKKAATKAASAAAIKAGEHIGKRAGDKIVQLLSKKQPMQPTIQPTINQQQAPMTDFEIAQRVNRLISGGRMKKR